MALLQDGVSIKLETSAPIIHQIIIPDYQDENQIDDQLCWAACISSALKSIKLPIGLQLSQEELACLYICPYMDEYEEYECNSALAFDSVVQVWRDLGFPDAKVIEFINTPDGELIAAELKQNQPIQAYMQGVHAIMIYGYRIREDNEENVLIMDPQNGVSPQWSTIDDNLDWEALWYSLKHQGANNA